jgi:peptidoglycan/xylan/chitin deacetylase (PgdA/CDA1 family)
MFRPPYGHQDFRSRFDLWTAGYRVITWNVVEPDWLDRDAETLASGILRRLRPGAIVLLHDGLFDYFNPAYRNREPTVKAVELVLRELSGQYKFVTVPDLLRRGRPRSEWWIRPADVSVLNELQRPEVVAHAE